MRGKRRRKVRGAVVSVMRVHVGRLFEFGRGEAPSSAVDERAGFERGVKLPEALAGEGARPGDPFVLQLDGEEVMVTGHHVARALHVHQRDARGGAEQHARAVVHGARL